MARFRRSLLHKFNALMAVILFCLIVVECSEAATQTINTVPSSDANFIDDNADFHEQEDAERAQEHLYNVVVSGGIGATDASLTHTISACVAYPYGYYVSQGSKSNTYTASKDTFVFLRHDDALTSSVGGAVVTYNEHFAFVEMSNGSSIPTDVLVGWIPLMEVVTDGTSITTVTDMRSGEVPLDAFNGNFSSAVNALVNRTLVLTHYTRLTANKTVPSTVMLKFLKGAIMEVDSGVTLTVQGSIIAGNYQIFSGSGTVDVSGWTGGILYPDWDSGQITGTEPMVDAVTLIKPAVYVNNSNGNPNISDTLFDVDNDVTEATWESVTDTGGGGTNTWAALDSVASDADWVLVKVIVQGTNGSASSALSTQVYARGDDGSQAVGGDNQIGEIADFSDGSGNARAVGMSTMIIPIGTNAEFDIYWTSNFTTDVIHLTLIGYGYNAD